MIQEVQVRQHVPALLPAQHAPQASAVGAESVIGVAIDQTDSL